MTQKRSPKSFGAPRYHKSWARRVSVDRRYANLRELWDTRWTPNNEAFLELVWAAVEEAGNRRRLAAVVGIRPRHLRRIILGETKAVSFRVADNLLARSSLAYKMLDLPWYTIEELMEKGIWKPPFGSHLAEDPAEA